MSDTSLPSESGDDAARHSFRHTHSRDALDRDHPWPGLEAFREKDRDFYCGREIESIELLRLVQGEVLTVLFGPSGLGKTSLLRAALFPALRTQNELPIYIRVVHDEQTAGDPVSQVMAAIRTQAAEKEVEVPATRGGETLWEYFHRTGAVFWSRKNDIVTPVLVFDQFEELFTLGKETPERAQRTAELVTQLADLIEGRVPESVRNRFATSPGDVQAFAFGRNIYRVLFSLREDFLPQLEDLRRQIPSIDNRMHLQQMTGAQALKVVLLGRHLLTGDDVADQIVRFVALGASAVTKPGTSGVEQEPPLSQLSVEPALLSLFCSELNEARGKAPISAELLRQRQAKILDAFYDRCMYDRAREVRAFVEDQLLTEQGYRDSTAYENVEVRYPPVKKADIDTLVKRRLLRIDYRSGVNRVEIAHDVLTPVIHKNRDLRRPRELAAKWRRRFLFTWAMVLLFLAVLLFVTYQWFHARQQAALTDYRVGLYQLQEGRSASGVAYLAHALALYPQTRLVTQLMRIPASQFIRTALFSSLIYTEWPLAVVWHPDEVTYAVLSPDGTRLLTVSADHKARLWDARTGTEIGAPMAHGKMIDSAAFSPDGTRVVTASEDGTARLWDGRTGIPVGESMRHRGAVRSATFSRDDTGTRVVTASEDGLAQIWDGHTGAPIGEPLRHEGDERAVYSAAFSPDGARVVTASADRTARVWDAQTGDAIATLKGHEAKVWSAAFSPDGTSVVTAAEDRTARLWDARSGNAIGEPMRHDGPVWSAIFSPDGALVATASKDRTARLWDAGTGQFVAKLQHAAEVQSVAFSPDGTRVVTASTDNTAHLWDAKNGTPGLLFRHEDSVWSAAFSAVPMFVATESRVVTASKDHTARLWNAMTGAPDGVPLVHEDIVYSAAFSPDGRLVVTSSADKKIRFWDVGTGDLLGEPIRQDRPVHAAAFSPNGAYLVTASDNIARILDARTHEPIGRPLQHGDTIWSVTFNYDGSRIVTASSDRTARLWDALSGNPVGEPLTHAGDVYSAAFSPDGTRVVTASEDHTARLWNASTRKPDGKPLEHDQTVWSAAFSPDGKQVVTASSDKTVRLWNAETGEPIAEPLRHAATVLSAAFGPDGEVIVTGSADGTARLWDAHTGTPIGAPLRHGAEVQSAAFSPDGTLVVTASKDNTARLWEVSAGSAIAANDLAAFTEVVAGRSLDRRGALTAIKDRDDRLADFCAQAAETKPGEPLTFPELVHWFCADRATRTISPRSAMKAGEYEAIFRRLADDQRRHGD